MSPKTPIRVMIADDHPLLREGIAGLIGSQADMLLVAEAETGREAVERFREARPDVVVLDIQMPKMSGIDALIAIRGEFADAKIIILTTYGGDALAQRALKAGAYAYVLKSMVRHELFETIRAVHAGQKRINPDVAAEIAAHFDQDGLTHRELEVLKLAASGYANKQIAARLSISEYTTKGHMKRITEKLGTHDRTHAVMVALSRGIFTEGLPSEE